MDLNRIPGARDQARLRYEESRREVAEAASDRVRDARAALARLSEVRAQRLEAARDARERARSEAARAAARSQGDELEISDRGRILAGEHRPAASSEEARAERVAELKERFQAGGVTTPEAIERAATRLLGAD